MKQTHIFDNGILRIYHKGELIAEVDTPAYPMLIAGMAKVIHDQAQGMQHIFVSKMPED